ncbi:DUF188 domain-containing protein, partial [bacterium]|nr:DUF188 domain-containing protein [bacterium]
MRFFIDGDAVPNIVKPILTRAINRLSIETIVVSNRGVFIGKSSHINYIIVASGPDEADNKIVEMVNVNELVITSDIPLADRVISKGAAALNYSGVFFDETNIKSSLAVRNLMTELRESNENISKGGSPLNQKQIFKFSNQLDS